MNKNFFQIMLAEKLFLVIRKALVQKGPNLTTGQKMTKLIKSFQTIVWTRSRSEKLSNLSINWRAHHTVWKVSLFGVWKRKNTDQNNSEHGYFLGSVSIKDVFSKLSYLNSILWFCKNINKRRMTKWGGSTT